MATTIASATPPATPRQVADALRVSPRRFRQLSALFRSMTAPANGLRNAKKNKPKKTRPF